MLLEHEKFLLVDKNGKYKLFAEINWEPNNQNTNEGKVLKFTCPGGEELYVDRKILNEMLFAIGRPEDQQKLIPQKLTRTRWYETVLSVKATKDIRKGEEIVFPIKLSLPAIEEEVIGEIKKSKTKTNIPLIGK